jgi:hypothetical protein
VTIVFSLTYWKQEKVHAGSIICPDRTERMAVWTMTRIVFIRERRHPSLTRMLMILWFSLQHLVLTVNLGQEKRGGKSEEN